MASIQITHNGITYPTVKALCKAHGILVSTFRSRLKIGLTMSEALSKVNRQSQNIVYNGKTYQSYAKLAEAFDIEPRTLYSRLERGLEISDALRNVHYNQRVI